MTQAGPSGGCDCGVRNERGVLLLRLWLMLLELRICIHERVGRPLVALQSVGSGGKALGCELDVGG